MTKLLLVWGACQLVNVINGRSREDPLSVPRRPRATDASRGNPRCPPGPGNSSHLALTKPAAKHSALGDAIPSSAFTSPFSLLLPLPSIALSSFDYPWLCLYWICLVFIGFALSLLDLLDFYWICFVFIGFAWFILDLLGFYWICLVILNLLYLYWIDLSLYWICLFFIDFVWFLLDLIVNF